MDDQGERRADAQDSTPSGSRRPARRLVQFAVLCLLLSWVPMGFLAARGGNVDVGAAQWVTFDEALGRCRPDRLVDSFRTAATAIHKVPGG